MTPLSSEAAQKSVFDEFDKFRSRIELTEQEVSNIAASHSKMRNLLENSKDISIVDSFLTGSYARQTMIRPIKDVDFFIQVHYSNHKNDNSIQLLNKTRNVLRKAYPLTPITITPPCVTVKLTYCNFEIVPAISIKDTPGLFDIPAEQGIGWQQTYPKTPDEWMTQENKKAEGLFIPTIKMIKRWRDTHKVPLRSFHLEMLTKLAFEYYNIQNYAQGVWAFFTRTNYLLGIYKSSPFVQEPNRTNVYVDQYLYNSPFMMTDVRRKILLHCGYAQKAFDYVSKGQTGSAKRLWKAILGSSFYAPSDTPLSASPLSSLLAPPLSLLPKPPQSPFSATLEELLKRRRE